MVMGLGLCDVALIWWFVREPPACIETTFYVVYDIQSIYTQPIQNMKWIQSHV